jgi:putative PIN family toxin of toxin-antitoxin system
MQKVVLDTNVIISALYTPSGKPAEVLKLARKKKITNLISPYILNEVRRVLTRKLSWPSKKTEETVQWLQSFSLIMQPPEQLIDIISACPPDNRILECAVEGGADYIISGDRHLKDLQEFQGIKIVDPATFLATIKNQTK